MVVLIEEDLKARNFWPMGRIVQIHGKPGAIRSVTLQTPSGRELVRPVSRLFPLEAGPEVSERSAEDMEQMVNQLPPVPLSPIPEEKEAEEADLPLEKEAVSAPQPTAIAIPQKRQQQVNPERTATQPRNKRLPLQRNCQDTA